MSPSTVTVVLIVLGAIVGLGMLSVLIRCLRKVEQGYALVRNGWGVTHVDFSWMLVFPVLHRLEMMDIQVKRIEIYRHGSEGLVCRDNIRADIKVAFFVKVNKTQQDVIQAASLLGCKRASQEGSLLELFDAKFSEALKTVGKQFDFVDLYTQREQFKDEILKHIGQLLNGYVLDDVAIDYLEQTPKERLNADNILDAEGIKKITDLTSRQIILANGIERDKEKTIRKQNVEAREAILELDKQQAEAEERQKREIAAITAREQAEAEKVRQQERLKSEGARILTEEQVQVAEQNKLRQIIVAEKSKVRTEQVETERVERDRALEATERERVVAIAQIEKEKAVEQEKKIIQDVIRERVMVERKVVEEKERIKDTEQFAGADRSKRVATTKAEEQAQEALIKEVRRAEAEKTAAERRAEQWVIEATSRRDAAERDTQAKKMLAEATAAESAAAGLGEAKVIEAQAEANQKQGTAEAEVMRLKYQSEAEGITQKAEAMKLLDTVGRDHEEFKLRLKKDLDVELAAIQIQKDVAAQQAQVVGQALKSARIDIVGGDTQFFDRIVHSVTGGKAIDRWVNNSQVLSDVKQTFFNGDPDHFQLKLEELLGRFSVQSEDLKNVSIAALIAKLIGQTDSHQARGELESLLETVRNLGWADRQATTLKLGGTKPAAKK